MTFNTGNPIGSTDARDLSDNTENMDYLENSTTELTHADRLGTVRKTRHGMEVEHDAQISAHENEHDAQISAHENEHDAQMQSFENDFDGRLAGMAFTRVGTFTGGYTLTDMRQTILWEISQGGDGHEYGWSGSFPKVVVAGSTPATTGGIGAGAWVDRTDVTLRSDLVSESGSGLVGYQPAGNGAVPTTVQSKLRESVSVFDFMTEAQIADVQAGTGSIDVTAAIQTAIATGKDIKWPAGVYLISGTLTGDGAWYGSGQGNRVYDSVFSGTGTFIRLSGENSGNAFLKPPKDFIGFHIDGVTKAGVAIDLGANASFTGFQRWKNITVRRCADAIRGFNFYSTSLENVIVQGNTRGVTITPTDGPGDDGYFTSTSWKNIHIADNDIYGLNVSVPYGTRTWTCENIVIERNGATGGTYQASLTNATLVGNGMYFEASSSIPALKLNVTKIFGSNWYFNGTGGIDASNAAAKIELSNLDMTHSTDVLANFTSISRLTLKNSTIYTDLRQAPHVVSLENVVMTSVSATELFRMNRFSVGHSADPSYQPSEIIFSYAGKKTVSTTINANSSVQIVGNTYFPAISIDAVGFGQVQGYYPGLIVQVTPATTGNTTYYTVRLINTNGSNITLDAVQVTWAIFRFNPVAV